MVPPPPLLRHMRPGLSCYYWYRSYFLGVRRPHSETGHSPPYGVKAKKCSFTATSTTSPKSLSREKVGTFVTWRQDTQTYERSCIITLHVSAICDSRNEEGAGPIPLIPYIRQTTDVQCFIGQALYPSKQNCNKLRPFGSTTPCNCEK